MIDDKISNLIDQALSRIDNDKEHPTSAVINVVSNDEDINSDIIERVVQGLNSRRIVDIVKDKGDLEEGCDLASPEEVKGTVVVKEMKEKKASMVGFDEFYYEAPRDYFNEKKANLDWKLEFPVEDNTYNVTGYVWEAEKVSNEVPDFQKQANLENEKRQDIEAVQDAYESLYGYLRKFAEYKGHDETFVSEIRHIFPQSGLLKIAGISDGVKRIPDRFTEDHKEFLEAERIWSKIAELKKYAAKKKNNDGRGIGGAKKGQSVRDSLNSQVDREATKKAQEDAKNINYALARMGVTTPGEWIGAAVSPMTNYARTMGMSFSNAYNPQQIAADAMTDMIYGQRNYANTARVKAKDGANKAIANIERRALFDSIVSDPDFENVNQEKLLKLYRDVSGVSPTLSKVPALVRSVFRAANASNNYDLSPETVGSLVKAEKSISDRYRNDDFGILM